MQNHADREVRLLQRRHNRSQTRFDFAGSLVRHESEPVRNADQVPIRNDAGHTKPEAENSVGCLAPNAWQRKQLFHRRGYPVAKPFDKDAAHPNDHSGLRSIEADRPEETFDHVGAGCGQSRWGRIALEQLACELVDSAVETLGGKDGGHQQLEGVGEPELALCWISGLEALDTEFGSMFGSAGQEQSPRRFRIRWAG